MEQYKDVIHANNSGYLLTYVSLHDKHGQELC